MESVKNIKENKKKSIIFLCIYVLLIIRILFLILIPPYIGIANNGDFERLMTPIGIRFEENPWETDEKYHDNFWGWVTNDNYVFCEPENNGWHQTYAVFSVLAILLSNKINNGSFDIRFEGITNVLLYAIVLLLAFCLLKRIQGRLSYFLLIAISLVLSDSYILQYFNSFYTEPGSVIFFLLTLCLQIYGFMFLANRDCKEKRRFMVIYFISVLLAVTCKQQDILTIVPLLFVSMVLFRKLNIRKIGAFIWAVMMLIFLLVIFKVNIAGGNITAFNVTNGDILANSECPEDRLRELNFNSEEIELIMSGIGESAFSLPYDWSVFEEKFTRKTEIQIILKEPSIFFKMIKVRCEKLFIDSPLGNYTRDSGALWGEKTEENRLWYKLKNEVYVHSWSFYFGVLFVSLIIAFLGFRRRIFLNVPKELFLVLGSTIISNVLRFFTVMLGDGSFDDIKHFFTINVEFDIIFISVLVCLIASFKYLILNRLKGKEIIEYIKSRRYVICSLKIIGYVFLIVLGIILFNSNINKNVGSTIDTMRKIEGVYSDGWFDSEGEFWIRTNQQGVISMTFYNPGDIQNTDEIVVYVNGKEAYRNKPQDHIILIDVEGRKNRVNKIKIVTSIEQNITNNDKRNLSLLLTELTTK